MIKDLFIINIDGIDVYVDFSKHAKKRGYEREVEKAQVLLSLQKDGAEKILDMHNNEEGVLYDKESNIAIVFALDVDIDGEIYITIKTVWNEKEYHFIPSKRNKIKTRKIYINNTAAGGKKYGTCI